MCETVEGSVGMWNYCLGYIHNSQQRAVTQSLETAISVITLVMSSTITLLLIQVQYSFGKLAVYFSAHNILSRILPLNSFNWSYL